MRSKREIMDLSAQHTVGAHSSFFLPSPGPGGQGEEKQSQYPSQLFIERQGGGAVEGCRMGRGSRACLVEED